MSTIVFAKEDKTVLVTGGENLRDKALQNGIDLYTFKGKLTNCGGYWAVRNLYG